MSRTAQISREKRPSIITLRHEGQIIQKMSRTLKVFSSAVAKTIKRYDEIGSHEDRHRKGQCGEEGATAHIFTDAQSRASILINGSVFTLYNATLNNATLIIISYFTLLISHVYTVFYSIDCTLPMPLCHRSSIYLHEHILIHPFRFVCIR